MTKSWFQTILEGVEGTQSFRPGDNAASAGNRFASPGGCSEASLRPTPMIVINREHSFTIRTQHGSEIRPLIDRTTSEITRCSLAEEVLPPGRAVPPHHHSELEEIYYLLSGTGVMTVGKESREVGAGDAIFVPRGERHTLNNTGSVPIKLLLVCGPAFFYEDEIIESGS